MYRIPVRTDLEKEFGEDKRAYLLFLLLLIRSRATHEVAVLNGTTVELERGQALFGRNSFAGYFSSPKTVERILRRLEKSHKKVTLEPTNKFTIVTILDYDHEANFDQPNDHEKTRKRPATDHIQDSKKEQSEKSVVNNGSIKKQGFQSAGDILGAGGGKLP